MKMIYQFTAPASREKLIEERARMFQQARESEQENARVVYPASFDVEEEISLLPIEKEDSLESLFLQEAFNGFGQG